MLSKKRPMMYELTFLNQEGETLYKGLKKTMVPLDNDTPRELQFMELADQYGVSPHCYDATLLKPEEAKKTIRQIERDRLAQSVAEQVFEGIDIHTVEDFFLQNKLRSQGGAQ